MSFAFCALGSNIGRRLHNIEGALSALKSVGKIEGTSFLYETSPAYVLDQPSFLNAVVKIRTELSATDLLKSIKNLEIELGRQPSIRYGPRAIDIDILFYQDEIMKLSDPDLEIPHPRIAERTFVLQPLADIAPDFVHPISGLTVLDMLKVLQDKSLVKVFPLDTRIEAFSTVDGLNIQENLWHLGERVRIMGILNCTTDSFSDGGRFKSVNEAVLFALEMVEQGVDIIDVGGESTRPGATTVSEQEEIDRVVPVIQEIRKHTNVPISIDTTKSSVAEKALEAGANAINDVSGGVSDPAILNIAAEYNASLILMHTRGTPETMNSLTEYSDVVEETASWLNDRVSVCQRDYSIPRWRIMIDPGIGFAKTAKQNIEIIRQIHRFRSLTENYPLLIGASRKRFLGQLLGRPNDTADQRDAATGGITALCAVGGCDVVRVHNVALNRDISVVCNGILREPLNP